VRLLTDSDNFAWHWQHCTARKYHSD